MASETCSLPASLTNSQRWRDFVNGLATETVTLEDETEIRTVRGLIDQIIALFDPAVYTTTAALTAALAGLDRGRFVLDDEVDTIYVVADDGGGGNALKPIFDVANLDPVTNGRLTDLETQVGDDDSNGALTARVGALESYDAFYLTETALLADLGPEDGILAFALDRGLGYQKLGASGAGSWSSVSGVDDQDGASVAIPVVKGSGGSLPIALRRTTGELLADVDRSTMRAGLAKLGLPTNGNAEQMASVTPSTAVDYNHIISYGDSTSIGAAGQPVVSDSQNWGHLTFTGGPRSDSVAELADVKPLVEDELTAPDGGGNRGETPCSGCASHLSRLIEEEDRVSYLNAGFDILGSAAGHGSWTLAQISKSNPLNTSDWYHTVLLAQVQAGYDIAQANGRTYAAQATLLMNGSNDAAGSVTRASYAADLPQLQTDFEADAQAISGQSHRIPMIQGQISYEAGDICLAQLDAAEANADIYIAFPSYSLAAYASGDQVHFTATGYAIAGAYFGRVVKRVCIDGREWTGLSPKSITRQGRVLTVELNVPTPPVVIDTTTLGAVTDYGFKAQTTAASTPLTIEFVAMAGPSRLRIVLDADPGEAVTLRYGLDYDNAIIDNFLNAKGGSIRDSALENEMISGTEYTLRNWLLHFEKDAG